MSKAYNVQTWVNRSKPGSVAGMLQAYVTQDKKAEQRAEAGEATFLGSGTALILSEPAVEEGTAPSAFFSHFYTASSGENYRLVKKLRQLNVSSQAMDMLMSMPLTVATAPPQEEGVDTPFFTRFYTASEGVNYRAEAARARAILGAGEVTAAPRFPAFLPATSFPISTCDVLAEIQQHMLESTIDSGITWASGLWTATEVRGFLQERLSRFLVETGLVQNLAVIPVSANSTSDNYPSDAIDVRRAVWRTGSPDNIATIPSGASIRYVATLANEVRNETGPSTIDGTFSDALSVHDPNVAGTSRVSRWTNHANPGSLDMILAQNSSVPVDYSNGWANYVTDVGTPSVYFKGLRDACGSPGGVAGTVPTGIPQFSQSLTQGVIVLVTRAESLVDNGASTAMATQLAIQDTSGGFWGIISGKSIDQTTLAVKLGVNNGTTTNFVVGPTDTNLHLYVIDKGATTWEFRADGNPLGSVDRPPGAAPKSIYFGFPAFSEKFFTKEFIYFPSNLSAADLTTLETNLMQFYGIGSSVASVTRNDLERLDKEQADNGFPGWEATTAAIPTGLIEFPGPSLSFTLVPPPSVDGSVEVLYIKQPSTITAVCTPLPIPDMFVPFVKWGVIADMLMKEGEANDPQRAQVAEQRFQLGIGLAKLMMGEKV